MLSRSKKDKNGWVGVCYRAWSRIKFALRFEKVIPTAI